MNCGCKRVSRFCGPGCSCLGTCSNAPPDHSVSQLMLTLGDKENDSNVITDDTGDELDADD